MKPPETTTIAIEMNDRLRRRVVLIANNDQKCITGMWIEENINATSDITINNTALYTFLSPLLNEYFGSLLDRGLLK